MVKKGTTGTQSANGSSPRHFRIEKEFFWEKGATRFKEWVDGLRHRHPACFGSRGLSVYAAGGQPA
jgi:hypothetical protein